MIGKKSQYEVNEVLPFKTHTDNVKKVKFYIMQVKNLMYWSF